MLSDQRKCKRSVQGVEMVKLALTTFGSTYHFCAVAMHLVWQ
jgi:hypothetical protein